MLENLETVFNRIAIRKDYCDIDHVAWQFIRFAKDEQAENITKFSRQMVSKVPKDAVETIYYQIARDCTRQEWDYLYKNFTSNKVTMGEALIAECLKAQDLDTITKLEMELETREATNVLRFIDYEWFTQNYYNVISALKLDIEHATFRDRLHTLIQEKRGDLFRLFYDKIETNSRPSHLYLLHAVRCKDQETLDFLDCDKTYQDIASLDSGRKMRFARQIIHDAHNYDISIVKRLFDQYKKHGLVYHGNVILERVVSGHHMEFFQHYLDSGEKIYETQAAELVGICLKNNYTKFLDLILSTQDPALYNHINRRDMEEAVRSNHVQALQSLYQHGTPSKTNMIIQNARSVEMLEFLRSKGYEMPEDRRKMITDHRPFAYRRYVEDYYLYKDLKQRKLDLTKEDLEFLSTLPLSNLRKVQTLPSGIKGRGITIAALAGHFDIVVLAAAKHKYDGQFSHVDLLTEDRNLKCRPIDALMANEQADALLDPIMWQKNQTNLENIWMTIPSHARPKLEHLYKNCLEVNSLQSKKSARKRPALKRR